MFVVVCCYFFFKQKTAYEMRISDWSSDVCSSDLKGQAQACQACCADTPIRVFLSACFLNHSPPVQSFWPMPCSHDGVETRSSASFPGCWTCHYRSEIGRASCRERVCQYV